MTLLKKLPLLLLLLSVPLTGSLGARAQAPDETVLRVNGRDVGRAPFTEWLVATRAELMMRAFVDHWLTEREARRLGVDDVRAEALAQTEEEIGTRIERAFRGDSSKWLEELRRGSRTPAGRRAERTLELEAQLMIRNIAAHERVVPVELVEREWERVYGPGGRRYDVRLLYKRFITPNKEEEREPARAALEAQMLAFKERVEAGELFAELVRKHSDDTRTKAAGGKPDAFDPTPWPAEALEELAALAPGGVSKPYFLRGGFWIVQLDRLVDTPLASVEDELRQLLTARGPSGDEMAAVRERLWQGVEWEVLPALFDLGAEGARLPLETPVVRIDGVDVSRGEVARYMVPYHADIIARRFAEEELIIGLAKEAGIEIDDKYIDVRVEEDLARMIEFYYQGDEEKWKQEALGARKTMETWRRESRHRTRVEIYVEELFRRSRVITDDVLRQVWEQRYGPGGVSLYLRMVRVDPVPPDAPPDASQEELQRLSDDAVAAARAVAKDVAQRAREGEDFGTLAKQFSSDEETRANGGELPLGFDYRTLPEVLTEAIDACKPGEVTGAIELGVMTFVFEVIGRREIPFDDVREALRTELENARPTMVETASHRNILVRDLDVEVLPELFR